MDAYDSLLLQPRKTTVFAGATAMMGGMPDPRVSSDDEENLFRAARGQQPILSGHPRGVAGDSTGGLKLTGAALGMAALIAIGGYFFLKGR